MTAPLINVDIPSVYKSNGVPVPLPARLAHATPDMAQAMSDVALDLQKAGGRLILSDLFRTYEMQMQSHLDYVNGKKKAFSPAPGGSFHEAGRAMDLSLSDLKIPLGDFWKMAALRGLVPIIKVADSHVSEAWHFECRGSHQKIIAYYDAGFGTNFAKAYSAGAASAIVALGIHVDVFGNAQNEARLQSALIRLSQNVGNLDGNIGSKTRAALTALGLGGANLNDTCAQAEKLLAIQYPGEYGVLKNTDISKTPITDDLQTPEHLDLIGAAS